MKKWLVFLCAVAIVGFSFLVVNTTNPSLFVASLCDSPILYRIGTVDTRFNVPREEFRQDIEKASSVWSNAYGKQLFVYDPKGELQVNLVYDSRQALKSQINALEGNVKQKDQSLNSQIDQLQDASAAFKKRVDAFNQEALSWSAQGGAPREVYDRLQKEQAELQKEAERLNAWAKEVNQSTNDYNEQIKSLNLAVDTFNGVLQGKPEEGLYDGNKQTIDIYFSDNNNELIHTLAHELGHALGIEHNINENSIMYTYSTESVTLSPVDTAALLVVCKERPTYEVWGIRLTDAIRRTQNK